MVLVCGGHTTRTGVALIITTCQYINSLKIMVLVCQGYPTRTGVALISWLQYSLAPHNGLVWPASPNRIIVALMLFWLLEQPSWNLRLNNESSKVLDQNQYFKWCDCFGQNLSPPFKSSSSNLKSYGVDGCCCCSRSAGIWELSVINNLWPVPLQNEAERMETRLGESKLHKFEPWTGSWPAQVLRCDEEYFKCSTIKSKRAIMINITWLFNIYVYMMFYKAGIKGKWSAPSVSALNHK